MAIDYKRAEQQAQQLADSFILSWIWSNEFVTENLKPFEFVKHRFLIGYLADDHPVKVTRKSSQVGWTVAETFDDFHCAGKRGLNVIHTLHNSDVLKGFVTPKVDPLIANNPKIKNMLRVNNNELKGFNHNFVYYRGANSMSQAINISADVLKIDEEDRSDAAVVQTFNTRLDYSEVKLIRRFSNPSAIGYGVDAAFADSNQFHWIVQCHHCRYRSYIDFEPSDQKNHYVDVHQAIYACGTCRKELSTNDRINGEWVAKYPSRDEIHGYWTSQMMAPWFSAKDIINKYQGPNAFSIDIFYNFVLGKAYTPQDIVVNREKILRACSPSTILDKTGVAMGVDQGVIKTYVLGTAAGIFAHGQTESWDEIEDIKNKYKAVMVMDAMPYQTTPKRLVDKYQGTAFMCYFKQDTKNLGIIQWGANDNAGVVYADRTKILDLIAQEIDVRDLQFRERPSELEDIIMHYDNLQRLMEEKENGRMVMTWVKKQGRMSDYPFALAYWRIALSRAMSGTTSSNLVTGGAATPNPDDMSGAVHEAIHGV